MLVSGVPEAKPGEGLVGEREYEKLMSSRLQERLQCDMMHDTHMVVAVD